VGDGEAVTATIMPVVRVLTFYHAVSSCCWRRQAV